MGKNHFMGISGGVNESSSRGISLNLDCWALHLEGGKQAMPPGYWETQGQGAVMGGWTEDFECKRKKKIQNPETQDVTGNKLNKGGGKWSFKKTMGGWIQLSGGANLPLWVGGGQGQNWTKILF